MEIAVRHNPRFAVARLTLEPGEECRAESGATMAMSGGVEIASPAERVFMKSLKPGFLRGEPFFQTSFRAPQQGVWVDCAARLPGNIHVFDVGVGVNLTAGCYLCSDIN